MLVQELADKEDITESLKASDQMEWGLQMNAVREAAMEQEHGGREKSLPLFYQKFYFAFLNFD